MARLFDNSSSQYLEYSGAVLSAYPMTLACWGYTDDLVFHQTLMMMGDADGTDYIRLYILGSSGLVGARVYDGSTGEAQSTSGYALNTWHHACAVFNSATDRRAFLDGANKGTDNDNITPTNLDLTEIGRHYADGSANFYMSGAIAEAAIWNVALTDFEVWLQAKLRLSPLWIRPQNLVFYSALLNNEDYDIVGRRKLTAVNGPTVAAHPPGIIYPPQPFGWAGPKSPRNINLLGRGLM